MASKKASDQTCLATQKLDIMLGTPENLEIMPHYEEEAEIQFRMKELIGVVITLAESDTQACIELYNSGTIRHISLYMHDFTSYSLLTPPIFLNTVNQQRFLAIGKSMLAISVPNRGTKSKLFLHSILYAPAIGCTLVLVVALDEEGYYTHISVSHLKLKSPQGEHIGHIPQTQGHLYKVVHTPESVNAVEQVSLMKLHCRLSHIALLSAHKLIESRAIIRIALDPNMQMKNYDACIFAWATRLPVPKIRISPPSKHFGNQIHSDVWGSVAPSTHQR